MLKFARDGIELDDLAARVEELETVGGPTWFRNGRALSPRFE